MDAATVTAAAGSATCLRRGLVGRSYSRSVRPPAMVSFADEGHLHYYASARCALKGESKKKEEKKREKLMKGLRKDLLEFSSMRFGADNEEETQGTVTGEVKSKMISEAADVLLAQLAQLRAEAKETKRRKKQEKKAAMKLAKAKDADSSSSSSSSESSDGECESTAVVRMSSIGRTTVPESHREVPVVPEPLAMELGEEKKKKNVLLETNAEAAAAAAAKALSNKIEVCMGGKCTKSGAAELLAEFDRAVGVEGAVVGCKCMGKCRDGPNVRVVNHRSGREEDAKKASRNPLCIGVSLEDVGAVVGDFFGASKEEVGFLAA